MNAQRNLYTSIEELQELNNKPQPSMSDTILPGSLIHCVSFNTAIHFLHKNSLHCKTVTTVYISDLLHFLNILK